MKIRIISFFCIASLMIGLMTGCFEDSNPGSTVGMVDDPFTIPAAETTTPATEQTQTENLSGPVSFGFCGKAELEQGDSGRFVVYSGSEMHFPFEITGEGYSEYGVGFLLFLDGIPQPYRTSENEEYSYMHILTIPDAVRAVSDEFIFIPTVGQKGDCLEFYIVPVCFPEYYKTASEKLSWTECSYAAGGRLLLEADPPQQILPELPDRVLSYEVSYSDLTSVEIIGWSEDDLRSRIESIFYANNIQDFGVQYNTAAGDSVTLKFEIYGCPSAQYGIVFVVDHEPLYIDPGKIHISTQYGQKTTIEVELDMSDFDGRRVVYALRVPRNFYSLLPKEASRGFEPSGSIFFLNEPER